MMTCLSAAPAPAVIYSPLSPHSPHPRLRPLALVCRVILTEIPAFDLWPGSQIEAIQRKH